MDADPKYPCYTPKVEVELDPIVAGTQRDLGTGCTVLADGRPAVISIWYERDLHMLLRTVWYSRLDTEEFNLEQHLALLGRSGWNTPPEYAGKGEALKFNDVAGNAMWSVTVVLDD
jgi:hypothetical protein